MGRTPMHVAIEGWNMEALDAMIKAGADLSSQDSVSAGAGGMFQRSFSSVLYF